MSEKITIYLVDPYLVNVDDLKDAKDGSIVRIRRPGWGKEGVLEQAMGEVVVDTDTLYLLEQQGLLRSFITYIQQKEKDNAGETNEES